MLPGFVADAWGLLSLLATGAGSADRRDPRRETRGPEPKQMFLHQIGSGIRLLSTVARGAWPPTTLAGAASRAGFGTR